VGTTLPVKRIVEEVVWPTRQIKEGYTLLQVITEGGQVLQGDERKQKETNGELILLDVTTARTRRIHEDQIEVRRQAGSPMPSGITSGLTDGQLLDLIRYLSTLGSSG